MMAKPMPLNSLRWSVSHAVDLLDAITTAIDNKDVNAFCACFHDGGITAHVADSPKHPTNGAISDSIFGSLANANMPIRSGAICMFEHLLKKRSVAFDLRINSVGDSGDGQSVLAIADAVCQDDTGEIFATFTAMYRIKPTSMTPGARWKIDGEFWTWPIDVLVPLHLEEAFSISEFLQVQDRSLHNNTAKVVANSLIAELRLHRTTTPSCNRAESGDELISRSGILPAREREQPMSRLTNNASHNKPRYNNDNNNNNNNNSYSEYGNNNDNNNNSNNSSRSNSSAAMNTTAIKTATTSTTTLPHTTLVTVSRTGKSPLVLTSTAGKPRGRPKRVKPDDNNNNDNDNDTDSADEQTMGGGTNGGSQALSLLEPTNKKRRIQPSKLAPKTQSHINKNWYFEAPKMLLFASQFLTRTSLISKLSSGLIFVETAANPKHIPRLNPGQQRHHHVCMLPGSFVNETSAAAALSRLKSFAAMTDVSKALMLQNDNAAEANNPIRAQVRCRTDILVEPADCQAQANKYLVDNMPKLIQFGKQFQRCISLRESPAQILMILDTPADSITTTASRKGPVPKALQLKESTNNKHFCMFIGDPTGNSPAMADVIDSQLKRFIHAAEQSELVFYDEAGAAER